MEGWQYSALSSRLSALESQLLGAAPRFSPIGDVEMLSRKDVAHHHPTLAGIKRKSPNEEASEHKRRSPSY
eukprot:m.309626 g.309626  ORF g.309626 m.309626 type:complete len:71 (+) comp47127_c0_seq1:119-331(+)